MWRSRGRAFPRLLPEPRPDHMLAQSLVLGGFMPTPLDPVVAQIIPLLPLRDPAIMTPQSARDALRALAAARAAIPPPPVESAADRQVNGAAGPLWGRGYPISREGA